MGHGWVRGRGVRGLLLVGLGVMGGLSLQAQQHARLGDNGAQDVKRYDLYTGFTDIDAPALGLNQRGFHLQAGRTMKRWYSMGFDYSVVNGDELLTADLLSASTKAQVLGAQQQFIALGLLPQNYVLRVPTHAVTNTFAFGPELVFRHYKRTTFFLRPSLGALRERATPKAQDPFQALVVAQLAPAGFKQDWTGFYGVGGGGEVQVLRGFGVRAQIDIVYNHPFNDILASGRTTYRYSVGPAFHFGHSVLR